MSEPRIPLSHCPSEITTTTHEQTHSANCWRWHHQCGVARIEALATALREALAVFDRVMTFDGRDEYFTARPVPAKQLDRWQRVLAAVAGADVTPDPAAPATTT